MPFWTWLHLNFTPNSLSYEPTRPKNNDSFVYIKNSYPWLATVQPQKWRFWSIFNFHVIARDALISSGTDVFDHGDHFFEIKKSRKKSERTKSDEKISFSLLESAPKGPQINFLPHQIRLEKLHLKIRFREYGWHRQHDFPNLLPVCGRTGSPDQVGKQISTFLICMASCC